MNKALIAAQLLVDGKAKVEIPLELLNLKLNKVQRQKLGFLTIEEMVVTAAEGSLHLEVKGEIDGSFLTRWHPAGRFATLGFTAVATGIPHHYDGKTGKIYAQVEDFRFTGFNPLKGTPLPEEYQELIGRELPAAAYTTLSDGVSNAAEAVTNTAGKATSAVGDGVKKVGGTIGSALKKVTPKKPKFFDRIKKRRDKNKTPKEDKPVDKKTQGFIGRQVSRVSGGISTAAGAASGAVTGAASGIGKAPGALVGILFSGVNKVLDRNALYTVPETINSIPARGVVEGLGVEGDKFYVILTTDKHAGVKLTRAAILIGIVTVVAVAAAIAIL